MVFLHICGWLRARKEVNHKMPIFHVGKEVSASDYWAKRSAIYKSNIDGAYHRHRLAMVRRLLNDVNVASSTCIDVGCGDGIFLEYLARRGADVIGFDTSKEMVGSARKRLSQARLKGRLFTGGLKTLNKIETRSTDLLLAINVIAYLTVEEESFYYREARRVLKEGGTMVVTHSNELFDMYTLNAFTVEFFAKYFCSAASSSRVSSLLTYPNEPERTSFNVRENPLTYRHKLSDYGFDELQQEFANFHPLPPLLMDPKGFVDIDAREYIDTSILDPKERWKLMFMCSMFGSRSITR